MFTQPTDTPRLPVARSLMFVPALRADLIAKVPRSRPDIAVIDLEDAVATGDKDAAREVAARALREIDFGRTVPLLRVNPTGTPWHEADLRTAARAGVGVVLPKYESLDQAVRLREVIGPDHVIVVGVESGRGVADARALLTTGIDAAYFGAEDYIADLGGRRTKAGEEVRYARSQVVLAAHLAGVAAIDQAVVAVHDDAAFVGDAHAGQAMGYQGKICIHPRQVELAHLVFTPSEQEIAHAHAVLRAAAGAGVAVIDGQMVDDVHARMAQAVLRRAASGNE